MGALDQIRVIDFGHYVAGPLTGMLLADQGAEVIKVDPPGGAVYDTPANATWNRGKKSICLDLHDPDDAAIAAELIAGADVIIENFRPGAMARFGLHEASLRERNPGLIYNAMPAFAGDDPRSAMPGWEGVVFAAADVFRPIAEYRNMVQVLHQHPAERTGPPVFTSEPIASCYAAMLSAVYITAALYARQDSGSGQRVEIPLFDAMLQAVGVFALSRLPFKPITTSAFSGFDHQYQCRDGRWVHIVCTVPRHGETFLRDMGREDFIEKGMASRGLGANPALNQELIEFLTETFLTRDAQAWEEHFQALDIPGVACLSTEEWLSHPQATHSDLLATVDDPSLGAMRQPGLQVKMSATPGAIQGAAPAPDQHREEILAATKRTLMSPSNPEPNQGLPLAGLKVLDLCIILAGPTCGRTLAELGADVIKIDDPNRGDVVYHHDINRAKRSILLDLKRPEGLEIFWQLVADADVVVQNFRSDVVARLGIDYESVKARKPDIIYASLNAYGDTGPMADQPGYEEAAQALTGMQVRFGGADRPILWPYGVVNDYGTGYAGAFGVLMALAARRREGGGQEVSSALARTACTLQSAHLQDYAGKAWDEPRGPDSLGAGPTQRLYECNDGWVFVGAHSPAAVADRIGISHDDAFETDLAHWCAGLSTSDAVANLRGEDVGIHALTWMNDMVSSDAVTSRGLIVAREHQKLGMMRTTGPGPWLSQSANEPGCPAPLPGADAASIFEDLGRDDLDALVASGVVRLP